MKKTALGVVLALMLAAVPATSVCDVRLRADSNSDVHIILIDHSHAPNIIVDNTIIGHQVPTATAFDTDPRYRLLTRSLRVTTRRRVSTAPTASRTVAASTLTRPGSRAVCRREEQREHSQRWRELHRGVGLGSGFTHRTRCTFQNSLNPTGFNRARFQLNNASLGDVCRSASTATTATASRRSWTTSPRGSGGQDSQEITAVQGAQVYVGLV